MNGRSTLPAKEVWTTLSLLSVVKRTPTSRLQTWLRSSAYVLAAAFARSVSSGRLGRTNRIHQQTCGQPVDSSPWTSERLAALGKSWRRPWWMSAEYEAMIYRHEPWARTEQG